MSKDSRDENPEAGASGRDREDMGALESILGEVIRRGASLGFSGFFLTEEAIRRAFSDRVPAEWADYVSQQSGSVRDELIERMAREFGNWLRTLDLGEIAAELLEEREVSFRLEIKPRAKSDASDSAASDGLRIFRKD